MTLTTSVLTALGVKAEATALARLQSGAAVDVVYDRTVREINANGLHDWFNDYGRGYGWLPEVTLTLLQEAANSGEVCIIVGKRQNLNQSGHIVAVVPERSLARSSPRPAHATSASASTPLPGGSTPSSSRLAYGDIPESGLRVKDGSTPSRRRVSARSADRSAPLDIGTEQAPPAQCSR